MKLYKKLRTKLFEEDVTYEYLAKKTGTSVSYISNRFSGKYPFSMRDAYLICDTLRIPYEEVQEYFPSKEVISCKLQEA